MNEVKMVFGECPVFSNIVDLEFTVGWNEAWLDWGQVDANDLGGWILVCEVAVRFPPLAV